MVKHSQLFELNPELLIYEMKGKAMLLFLTNISIIILGFLAEILYTSLCTKFKLFVAQYSTVKYALNPQKPQMQHKQYVRQMLLHTIGAGNCQNCACINLIKCEHFKYIYIYI